MFYHLLESSRWDDSNKWSNIGFGEEIRIIEIKICILSGALCYCYIVRLEGVQTGSKVTLPVYLNATRAQLLFTLDFEMEGEGSGKDHSFYERGVALVSSDLG